jgi:hypothetical protein
MKTAKPLVSVRNPGRQLWRFLLRPLAGTGRATKIWYCGLVLTAAGSLTLAGAARADVPPPDGYVETCTIAKRQTATSECLFCEAERSTADRCEPLLAPYCYVKVCQAWGGSGYPELWCRTKGAEVAPVPSETLNALNPTVWPLPYSPDGGAVTAPSSCLPYSPPTAAPDANTPSDSSGCAVGGWLSVKALGPWLLAGLFGVVVTLARRRRR